MCIGTTDIYSSVTIFLLEARRHAREKQSEHKLCVFLDLFLKCKLLSKEEKEKKKTNQY